MNTNAVFSTAHYDGIEDCPVSTAQSPVSGEAAQFILAANSPAASLPFMGGKASNLYRLTKHGVPVPAWFCLSSQVCSDVFAELRHVVEGRLSRIDYDSSDSIQQASDAIRRLIEKAPIPAPIRHHVGHELDRMGASHYAVRSSGLAEDSTTGSFAGQFDTFLYVSRAEVLDHIKRCWASAFTARNLVYTHRLGLKGTSHAVAVIIQIMVDSEAAGIMFMANPAGSMEEIVVVSGYGLGEGVVSDLVETDTCIYDRTHRSWRCDIGDKRTAVRFDSAQEHGTSMHDVTRAKRHVPVLTEDQREALIKSGETISGLYSCFQDIEWAFDAGGKLYITQCRPITTIPYGSQSVFDNSNIVESYPGVTSPLTVSHIRHAYEVLFRNALLRLGVSKKKVRKNDHVFRNMLGYLGGRVYYNLTNWYQMFRLVPATESYLPVWEEMLGIANKSERLQQPWLERFSQLPRIAWVAMCTSWYFIFLNRYMKRCSSAFRRLHQDFRARDLTKLSNHELANLYHCLNAQVLNGWEITLLNDLFAFVFSATVRRQLRSIGLDENVFGGLMAGDAELESTVPVSSMIEMAEIVRRDPVLSQQLDEALDMPRDDLCERSFEGLFANEEFVSRLQIHLEQFGDRSLEELKLESACFRDDPKSILQLIATYAASEVGMQGLDEKRNEAKAVATARLNVALRGRPVRRLLIDGSLALARRSIRYRESSRLDRARAFGIVRSIFRSLGSNLAKEGALDEPGDVFYLTVDEVLGFITGTSVNEMLRGLVDQRKADQQHHESFKPADRIRSQGTVRLNVVPPRVRTPGRYEDGTIHGTGCSAGLVTAEAILVHKPSDAGDIRGKVLVAEMTDPGWVFLMVSAAGLVVEKGSLLSHTAIIGRELGVPTVVGVQGATELIRNGQVIQVNGQTGEIVLQDEEKE
jgi:phosphohistidine swiveling domain-containing protein